MRLSSLSMVNRYAEARKALLHRIAIVETPGDTGSALQPRFRVLVDGDLLDEPIVALVRPVLLRELRAQVKAIDRDLEALGVKIDDDAGGPC